MRVTYSSNNSGGSWWLTEEHWKLLEAAGWTVDWSEKEFLGAKATYASIEIEEKNHCMAIEEARKLWESAILLDPYATGCDCCGSPHNFYTE